MALSNYDRDLENGAEPPPYHNSSSSSSDATSDSTASTSPATTPPDSPENVKSDIEPRVKHDASFSATPPRRGRGGRMLPTNNVRLGVIDEHSNTVAPDIPTRHPARKLIGTKYGLGSLFGPYSRSDKDVPPVDAYEKIVGPRGEKFGDVRKNKATAHTGQKGKGSRKRLWIGLIVLLVLLALGLGIGLGVGLRKNNETSDESVGGSTASSNKNDTQPFPVGTYRIPTYLTTATTSCTTNPSTFRCFPYTTYVVNSPSASASFNTLIWQITDTESGLRVSNTDPTFSYPFTDVPLTLSDFGDPRLAAYTFTFPFRKQVVPSTDITGDGAATRCYYNDTAVSVRLYANEEGAGGQIVDPPRSGSDGEQGDRWPYAVEYDERIGSGPQCFRYVNGQETDLVAGFDGTESGTGECVCGYRNYGLEE